MLCLSSVLHKSIISFPPSQIHEHRRRARVCRPEAHGRRPRRGADIHLLPRDDRHARGRRHPPRCQRFRDGRRVRRQRRDGHADGRRRRHGGRDEAACVRLHQRRLHLHQHGVLELPECVCERQWRRGRAGADADLCAGSFVWTWDR